MNRITKKYLNEIHFGYSISFYELFSVNRKGILHILGNLIEKYGSKTFGLVIFKKCRKFLALPKVFPEAQKRRFLKSPKVLRPPKVFNQNLKGKASIIFEKLNLHQQ